MCPLTRHFSFWIIWFSVVHETFTGALVESMPRYPSVVFSASVLLSQRRLRVPGLLTRFVSTALTCLKAQRGDETSL